MNGETYTAAVYNTPDGQWILTHIVSFSQLTGKLHVIGYWISFIGFAVFALAVVLAFLISGNISQNLKLLTDSMKQFSNGNLMNRSYRPVTMNLQSLRIISIQWVKNKKR